MTKTVMARRRRIQNKISSRAGCGKGSAPLNGVESAELAQLVKKILVCDVPGAQLFHPVRARISVRSRTPVPGSVLSTHLRRCYWSVCVERHVAAPVCTVFIKVCVLTPEALSKRFLDDSSPGQTGGLLTKKIEMLSGQKSL